MGSRISPTDSRTGPRQALLPLAIAVAMALVGLAPASASAHIYWANSRGTIERATNDGSEIDRGFIDAGANPRGVAVDDTHVYWATRRGTIGRARLDGSRVNPHFITGTGRTMGIAIGRDSIYWVDRDRGIGRARLKAPHHANRHFIADSGAPLGIAADAHHIYWTSDERSSISRADLDGTDVQLDLVSTPHPYGIATGGSMIFWTNSRRGVIGRAERDGERPDRSWIDTGPGALGIALTSERVFWTAAEGRSQVGRAHLGGNNIRPHFIRGRGNPNGIAAEGDY